VDSRIRISKPQRNSSETSVNLYQSAPRNIQEGDVWDSCRYYSSFCGAEAQCGPWPHFWGF